MVEGENLITAVAHDEEGDVGTATIAVTLDTQPPVVTIHSPPDGLVTMSPAVTVTGMINDIVVGTVNAQQATVLVNGQQAAVANRSFLAADVPLDPGVNTIEAIGTDRAGNTATTSVQVDFQPQMNAARIELVSGNNQTGPIGGELLEPLVVALIDADNSPLANEPLVFQVTENNGLVSDGTRTARSVVIFTAADGTAQCSWTLGTRAGAGNNVVNASSPGITGAATFTAIAEQALASRIFVDSGNLQTGETSRDLARPFVAVVTDAGNNRAFGVPVTFNVVSGGGDFDGAESLTVDSDTDGRVLVVLTLGPDEGFDNNVVSATFEGNRG